MSIITDKKELRDEYLSLAVIFYYFNIINFSQALIELTLNLFKEGKIS